MNFLQWLPWALIPVTGVFGYMLGRLNGECAGSLKLWLEIHPQIQKLHREIERLNRRANRRVI